MQDDRQMDLALWRYGIISPLLHRNANAAQLWELLTNLSEKSYIHPHDGRFVTVSAEAMRKWLYRYNWLPWRTSHVRIKAPAMCPNRSPTR